MSRQSIRWFLLVSLLLPALAAYAYIPTARSPLPPPLFSIDPLSPSSGLFLPGDVLAAPDPTVEIHAENMSLFDELDDVNALSSNNTMIDFGDTFVLILSVDRATIGAVAPDPVLVAMGLPFNVQDQADKNQAAGDAYMSLLLYTRYGPIPPGPGPLAGSHSQNNSLVTNQGDAGGVHFGLDPNTSPFRNNPPFAPIDDADAGALTGGHGPSPVAQPDFIFFSVARDSPSLPFLPGATPSGADIFFDVIPFAPGGEFPYVSPFELGLQQLDDINACIIFDDGDFQFTPGADQVVFSLTPDSPSLGDTFCAADLLSSFGGGVFDLYSRAQDMGLACGDNLNMLDYALCEDVLDCAYYWAIGVIMYEIGPAAPAPAP